MQNGPAHLTQRAPILTVQEDMKMSMRLAISLGGLAAATLGTLGALAALSTKAPGMLPIGLGRLCDYLLEKDIPGAGFLASLERGHVAAMFFIGALLLVFGRSAPPQPAGGQRVVFHRRASIRRQLPALLAAAGLLIAGWWLARAVHPLIAGLVELPATLLIGWLAWHALIPEMRTALTVIVDDRQGFANRIELSGGLFNKLGRITIRHEDLDAARILEPTWTRLFSYRDLFVGPTSVDGRGWRIDAIAPARELAELAGYLNGDFKYGISLAGLNFASRFIGPNGGSWS
jgi:hypothetical protein